MAAQNNIDRIIPETTGKRGFFVEAEGSDPFDQISNQTARILLKQELYT